MKTKKLRCLLMLAVLIFGVIVLVGCGQEQQNDVTPNSPLAVTHPIEGKDDCLSCHQEGQNGAPKMTHNERPQCLSCHKPA